LASCLCLHLLVAAPSAATPIAGVYNSTDLGGALLTGRASTSRACVNTCGGIGDVFNVASWDGATLGTQWTVVCGIESTPYTVNDGRVNGTGPVTYTSTFNGGAFNFNPGPWGSGSGTLNTTLVITTVQYVNINGVSTPVASRANVQTSGTFDEGCTLTFAIANGIGVGETPMVKPATYPAFIDTDCQPTRIYGTWGDVGQITMSIDCATPTHRSTWGAIKNFYR
jgi:hypothetical protein